MLLKALFILLCFVFIFGCLDAAPNKLKQLSKKSIKNMRRWLSDKRQHSPSSSSSTISLSSNEEVGPSNGQLVIDENRLAHRPAERQRSNAEHLETRSVESSASRSTERQHPTTQRSAIRPAESRHPTESVANDPAERQRSNAEHLETRSVESSVSRSTERQHPTTQRSAILPAESRHPTESQANCQSEAIDYCTICQSSLSDGGILKELQKCKHSFHQDCIDKWLTDINHNSCPNCREEVSPSELSLNQTQQMNTSQSVYNNPLYHVSAPALSAIPRDQLRLLYAAPPGSFVRLRDYYGRVFTVHVIE